MLTERERREHRRRWRRRWRAVKRTPPRTWLLLVGSAAVAVFAGFVLWSPQQTDRPTAADVAPNPEREEPGSVLVVGDSWTTGGPTNDGPEWPWRLNLPDGWAVVTDAVGGTGYIGGTLPGAGIRSGRLQELRRTYEPDAALIAIGRNDVWRTEQLDEVLGVARSSLSALKEAWPDCEIVVLSPFSPGDPDPGTVTLTEGLREISESLDLQFVDVSRLIDSRSVGLIENYHPTDAGQRIIAKAMDVQLAELGVFE